MSDNVIQVSFAGGELSPGLNAHVDLEKYKIGAALLENFFVDYRGGASTRVGTRHISQAYLSVPPVRLIKFEFNAEQTYMLEFGEFYMRVIKDGAPVLEPPLTINAITQSNPAVFTVAAHGFVDGESIFINNILGMTQLNQITGSVVTLGPNQFYLRSLINGVPFDSTSFPAYLGGGTASRVYTIPSPYAAADLALLKFTQNANVMTLAHRSYLPRELTRASDTSWAFAVITFAASIAAPTGVTAVSSGVGTTNYVYAVTAISANGEESVESTRFSLTLAVDISATAGSNTITWAAVAGAVRYNIYKFGPVNGSAIPAGIQVGFMGFTTSTTMTDANIQPDFTLTPPRGQNPFLLNNPGAVAYFQQRRMFAASTAFPQTFWGSQPGLGSNFDTSDPVRPDDAIEGTLVSRQVNQIKHMLEMPGGLVLFTSGGVWQLSGTNGTIAPDTLQATPQAYNGASDVEPIPINYDILFVQSKGTIVRSLSYSFYNNIYSSEDISVLASHLFQGHTIVEWAYAEEPFKVVWAVRSDGKLLSLTFLKEQKIYAWAQHFTKGFVKSISVIREGSEDAVYMVVQRFILGVPVQYIERMAPRLFTYGSEDAWAVDDALQTAPREPGFTIVVSNATGSVLVIAAGGVGAAFSASDVGNVIRVGGGIIEITVFDNGLQVQGEVIRPIEVVLPGTTIPLFAIAGQWGVWTPVTTVSGLQHLEGQEVAILGDGNVFEPQTVTDGAVSLNQPASKIVVGLPYRARLQTLNLDIGEPTIQGKRKKLSALTMRVNETRGLKAGNTFDTMVEYKQRGYQALGTPIELETGDEHIVVDPLWQEPGRLCIEVSDPVPATVLGVIPEITVGDD